MKNAKLYTVSRKTCHFIFDDNWRFLVDFFAILSYRFCSTENKKERSAIINNLLTWRLDDVITVTHRTSGKHANEMLTFKDKFLSNESVGM